MRPPVTDLPPKLRDFVVLFLKRYPMGVATLFLGAIFASACFASVPYVTKLIVDKISHLDPSAPGAVREPLHLVFILVASLVGQVLGLSLTWIASYHSRFVMLADMRRSVFAYVQKHDTTYFDNMLSGKIGYRATALPEQAQYLVDRCGWELCPAITFYLMSVLYISTIKPILALLVLIWLAIYFGTCVQLGRRNSKLAAAHNEAKSSYTGRVFDALTNIKNVIFFARHDEENAIIQEATGTVLSKHRRLYKAMVRMRLFQHGMNITMYTILFLSAIYGWSRGWLSVGDFSLVATQGILLVRNAHDIGQMLPDFFDYLGSAQESLDVLIAPRSVNDKSDAPSLKVSRGEIRLDHVSFGYDKNQAVVKDMSLTIAPGQKLGVIGHSGAGKTTLSTLLLRLHDVDSGHILIDGQDIADVKQDSLRRSIALIPQDTILFHRSLMDNIRYGRFGASEEDVIEAAKRAHAHEFIELLPRGYDTLVGERGVKLSGGQRQRIAIARAILKNAPILILDEATSALDSESEAAVQDAMKDVMTGKTVIAIAHRLSTIAHLDRLIVMDMGHVVEDGSHAELLEKNGIYAQLWGRQSGGFLVEDV